ncbi:MAG: ATP-binding protein, partial [Rhodospirillaceae bacterium]
FWKILYLVGVCVKPIGMLESYPGPIAQVLTNFVMNALTHAFAPGQAGVLTVVVSCPVDNSVQLIFSDNGKGIPEAILPKIFDPFFTTNRSGGGSGLGLNIVYNLVRQRLHGDISVASIVGNGTSFTVRVPRVL